MADKVPVLLTVLGGSFASQPLAFARLVDCAEAQGLSVDLADVDVIRAAFDLRLAHYFRPGIVARIAALKGDDDTLIVLRPSLVTAVPDVFRETPGLHVLGRFAGVVVQPSITSDIA